MLYTVHYHDVTINLDQMHRRFEAPKRSTYFFAQIATDCFRVYLFVYYQEQTNN